MHAYCLKRNELKRMKHIQEACCICEHRTAEYLTNRSSYSGLGNSRYVNLPIFIAPVAVLINFQEENNKFETCIVANSINLDTLNHTYILSCTRESNCNRP
ncbi:CLUMA_CG014986, isoform A [Clunio marinus]|uniref:CLUMA_CG014986, isoform A n=1 Tax=Clunio marinus TaxID=568069 RepID=A0A1J1IPX0_9DIPT|nr:CLUMA_CG014986, isoform A [Clunio marinus]